MNHLVQSASPYLLQHAANPVDWYPWGEEAISKAQRENKPIFLSIGYAACHWCHVMAHESFEDPKTAALLNGHFICIKVDREERPDIDSIYMQAVVAMTGSGGWPMSVFLLPDLKPFLAGTYFPPKRRYRLPSFQEVLGYVTHRWKEEKEELERLANGIASHLQACSLVEPLDDFRQESLDLAARRLLDSYDWRDGGWGDAPKFPQPMVLHFAMVYNHLGTRRDELSERLMQLVEHCLSCMARGGMYDVVGGGFSRYSTDTNWLVPHFEKMLYDNALLARAYLQAWRVTGKESYGQVLQETLDFVLREMTHPEGGFYSSLDADSEGVEGKFYVWTLEEIRSILQEDTELFEAAFGLAPGGNWEGRIVLQRLRDDPSLGSRFHLPAAVASERLKDCLARLFQVRVARIHPATDDKILTAWNGLMLAVLAEAARSSGHRQAGMEKDKYYLAAVRNARFLLDRLRPDGHLRRSCRDRVATPEVFLEDFAALILGLLQLYQTDFKLDWFRCAVELAEEMIDRFSDPAGGFFDTPNEGRLLLLRPKDLQDNATPSGNALACEALLRLAAFTGSARYREIAEKTLTQVGEAVLRYPVAFGRWLSVASLAFSEEVGIAVLYRERDEAFHQMVGMVHSCNHPSMILAASAFPPESGSPALLHQRGLVDGQTTAYVCQGTSCHLPITHPEALKKLLDRICS